MRGYICPLCSHMEWPPLPKQCPSCGGWVAGLWRVETTETTANVSSPPEFKVGDVVTFAGSARRSWWRKIIDWFMLRDPPAPELRYFEVSWKNETQFGLRDRHSKGEY